MNWLFISGQALLFAFALFGGNFFEFTDLKLPDNSKRIVIILVIALYILAELIRANKKVHSFKDNAKAFSKFFKKWYSAPGKLSIFCTDLEWLNGNVHAPIVDALKVKKGNLSLYLRNEGNDQISQELIKAGAQLFRVKGDIKTSHRFSIRHDDDIQTIIIRDKDLEKDRVVFIESDSYSNPYLVSMALDMLNDCYEK